MKNITEYNLTRYSNFDEFDIYSNKKNHAKRIEIIINMVNDIYIKSNRSKKAFTIIDLGGNTGVISKRLADMGYTVTVADISKEALRSAGKKGLKTICIDLNDDFSIIKGKYDLVIAGEIIEHILDTKLFLDSCYSILKKDGFLVLSTPNLNSFTDRFNFLFGKSPRQINPFHPYLKYHIRFFNYSSLKFALKNSSFNIKLFKSNYFAFFNKRSKRVFVRLPAILFPTLGDSLIVAAQKVA